MIFIISSILSAYAQGIYRYRISLTDKSDTEYSLSHPELFLSEKALLRRAKQGLQVDSTDLPVCRSYIKGIAEKGVDIINSSKWNNTVLVECPDTIIIEKVLQ